jgi:alcohol dehydrogenase
MNQDKFMFNMPTIVYYGENVLANLSNYSKGKIVIFTDKGIKNAGLLETPLKYLDMFGTAIDIIDDVPAEPSVEAVESVVKRFRSCQADLIVAIGGGSVMDVAKLASVLDTDTYTVRDLLDNSSIARKAIKTIMIPTTAGTGSEATPNSIVLVPEQSLKVGIVSEALMSDIVFLDAEMIKNLPQQIAATTGIDALAHCLECFTSKKSNPFSDVYAAEGLKLIFNNIEKACNTSDMAAKRSMQLASFFGGVAISMAGTTAVHALSYPLGGKYHIAHGMANAILLSPVMKFNEEVCRDKLSVIYDRIYPNGSIKDTKDKSRIIIERLDEIMNNLNIPRTLKNFNVDKKDIDNLVDAGMKVTRLLVNNLREVKSEDARKIYLDIL